MRPASLFALVFLALLQASTVHAADGTTSDEHEAAALEVLSLIGIDEGVQPMMARMRDTTVAQIAALDVAEGEEQIAAPYLDRIAGIIEDTLSWERLRADFVAAYTEKFSEDELRTLATFFRSPVGAKYLANVTELNRLAMEIVRAKALAAAPEIRVITEELQAALPADPAT